MGVSYSIGTASTYKKIATTTLGSAGVISFTNIPQNFTDLVLILDQVKSTAGTPAAGFRFNNDSSGLYSTTLIEGTGSTAYSDMSPTNRTVMYVPYNYVGLNTTNGTTIICHIMNYSNSSTYKTALFRFSNATGSASGSVVAVGSYRSTNSINRIDIGNDSVSNVASGATATLYGIEAAKQPKATGGLISTDGAYWYHSFPTTGVFTPLQSLTADILCVGGGGGGGCSQGGGGGAGGFLTSTSVSLSAPIAALVGTGGAGAPTIYQADGTNGTSSSINGLVSYGGGGGGTGNVNGLNGASGGGGGGGGAPGSGGSASYGSQGNAGANASGAGYYPGGGGGGAGHAGYAPANSSTGGLGGDGSYTSVTTAMGAATGYGQLSGGNYYFAGGGGGGTFTGGTYGTGGVGGGGRGGYYGSGEAGVAGTANTGGGGGASSYGPSYPGSTGAGGQGGSGIIIVRYAV